MRQNFRAMRVMKRSLPTPAQVALASNRHVNPDSLVLEWNTVGPAKLGSLATRDTPSTSNCGPPALAPTLRSGAPASSRRAVMNAARNFETRRAASNLARNCKEFIEMFPKSSLRERAETCADTSKPQRGKSAPDRVPGPPVGFERQKS